MRRKNLRTFLLVVGLSSISVLGCEKKDSRQEGAPASGDSPSDGQVPAQTSAKLVGPDVAYQFRYRSKLTVQGQQLVANLSGELLASKPWNAGERVWTAYRVAAPNVEVVTGAETKTAIEGIGEPFLIGIDAKMNDVQMAMQSDASKGSQQILSGLAGVISPRVVPEVQKETWVAEEQDVSGQYQAQYTLAPDGWLEKRKLKYADSSSGMTVVRSEGRLKLDAKGMLTALTILEELSEPSMGIAFETTLTLTALADGAGSSQSRGGFPEETVGKVPTSWMVAPIDRIGSLDRADVKNAAAERRFLDVFSDLKESSDGILPVEDLLGVKARLERNPEETAQVLDALKKDPERAGTLAALLVAPQTKQAEKAVLLVLTDSSFGERARLEVLNAVLFGGGVSKDLIVAVQGLRTEKNVQMSLGAIDVEGELLARAIKLGRFDVTDFVKSYLSQASDCGEPARCAAFIRGLGYLGTPDALDLLRRHLTGPIPTLRSQAAASLEKSGEPRVDDWLSAALLAETDDMVSIRLMRSCALRGSASCLSAFRKQLNADVPVNARRLALRGLGGGRFPSGQAEALIKKAAHSDADAGVRGYAEKLLAHSNEPDVPAHSATKKGTR